jgi:acylphosphatase
MHLSIAGRVQGVCYRMNAVEVAERLGLAGWVRNTRDGGVELLAEGPDEDLADLLAWCRHGPPHARVTDVDVSYSPATGEFSGFEVAY